MAEGQIVVVDEGKMLERILEFPSQLEQSWADLWTKELPLDPTTIHQVIICGMGGSGIAGVIAKSLFQDSATIPIAFWHDYGLPMYAGPNTLVLAVSDSGDTEETLDSLRKAFERKCQIVVISRGGKDKEVAQNNNIQFVEVKIDAPPRAALGYLLGSVLAVLTKAKLINLTEQAYFLALGELKNAISQKTFPAKAEELSISLNNKVPLILASEPLSGVAKRWQNQFNENSKTFAVFQELPEACHNVIQGLDFAIDEKIIVLNLVSNYGFSRNVARGKILQQLFSTKEIPFVPLTIRSGSALAEQFLFSHFGDLLSYYLAGVNGVDPTPVEDIDKFKEGLMKL
ncbi:hypothetical protein A3A71_02395 [Candidatus Berkelbacteria bacterium RIFCSPLOWO2_01_FULL_50_28]|uniref:SIS domain-containing protein n=1 Tax=Candidatus Berkelbacteria bacterium RIFCSPLOWO2_01_FULL_50_28 TaxID=1797471 RepID=A0A1F5EBT2_9BACT|nr:MAG: hypothetical protein A2807_00790 [Candidatus Berkelbacteria bacterium RIFCSPHIGHO2_01_FULL_50_36]OGD62230.1 MAG: hypothetical protein A3F39_00810 [Candidatus Berkelbacteria bacterium RIFCSPHIGHO2_12_FULL_50_11]OGD64872.1 MAG: hypothetical protein A3A71_02395 [Candidatus Berkelbacteria bacterium RIFCSPLOWO2_01_FULL_50_28]